MEELRLSNDKVKTVQWKNKDSPMEELRQSNGRIKTVQ